MGPRGYDPIPKFVMAAQAATHARFNAHDACGGCTPPCPGKPASGPSFAADHEPNRVSRCVVGGRLRGRDVWLVRWCRMFWFDEGDPTGSVRYCLMLGLAEGSTVLPPPLWGRVGGGGYGRTVRGRIPPPLTPPHQGEGKSALVLHSCQATTRPPARRQASSPPSMWQADVMPASWAACTAMAERSPNAQ